MMRIVENSERVTLEGKSTLLRRNVIKFLKNVIVLAYKIATTRTWNRRARSKFPTDKITSDKRLPPRTKSGAPRATWRCRPRLAASAAAVGASSTPLLALTGRRSSCAATSTTRDDDEILVSLAFDAGTHPSILISLEIDLYGSV